MLLARACAAAKVIMRGPARNDDHRSHAKRLIEVDWIGVAALTAWPRMNLADIIFDFLRRKLVERFQNLADRPYQIRYTAAAFHCLSNFSDSAVTEAKTDGHPDKKRLSLLLVKGAAMMQLVNRLYEVAANEA